MRIRQWVWVVAVVAGMQVQTCFAKPAFAQDKPLQQEMRERLQQQRLEEFQRQGQHIQQIKPEEPVLRLWNRVLECAGEAADTTKKFEQIKWFQRDTIKSRFSGYIREGEWVEPDTIFITRGFERDAWVVAHEMLHYAINNKEHPWIPFGTCGLMVRPGETRSLVKIERRL